MSEENKMPTIGYVPAYPDVQLYSNQFGKMLTWEGDGWQAESLAWKKKLLHPRRNQRA